MKILKDYKDLVGKKIIFSHMAQFAKQITIATEDGCVLMINMDCDEYEDEKEIKVLCPTKVLNVLNRHKWLREELGKLGIFDIEKYKEEERLKYEKEKEERRKKQEEKEKAEYERLKLKFEK